jgi:predicted AAA+ superfamily ATPase
MNKPSPADSVLALLAQALDRISGTLERMAPPAPSRTDFNAADAFIWQAGSRRLEPVKRVNRVEMRLLKGIDRMRDTLLENTERFAKGLPANNALLWGARGMGKSSLVKAVHAQVAAEMKGKTGFKLVVKISSRCPS